MALTIVPPSWHCTLFEEELRDKEYDMLQLLVPSTNGSPIQDVGPGIDMYLI